MINPTTELTEVDKEAILQALSKADMNALRIALYQQTGDPELAAMKVPLAGKAGNPYKIFRVSPEDQEVLIKKAFDYLSSQNRPLNMNPDREEVRALLELFEGQEIDKSTAQAGYEELAFGGFKRAAQWPTKDAIAKMPDGFKVLIIGAGFSSIVCAIQLDILGIEYRIIERQPNFGGTWCWNTYPDARVDITSFLYNYTFEVDYPWVHTFAPREELEDYIAYIVDKFDLRKHAQFNTKVTQAKWNESTAKWEVAIEDGDQKTENLEANILLSASGLFSTPKLPDIAGIDDFKGKMFHTTAWDHSYDYSGKRVALIGTGSTGSQLLPRVAPDTESMTVFQRTPNWVAPVPAYRDPIIEERKWLLKNMPAYSNWNRYTFISASMRNESFLKLDKDWQAKGGYINEKNDLLRDMLINMISTKMAPKPEYIDKLIPGFAPLSRRIVIDNGWYDTLLRDNVELISDGISHITENGVVDANGVEHEFDLIVLAAGFEVERYLWPVEYLGRDGASLEELWSYDGARAHMTMTLPGFPNFFMMYGPNAGVKAGSFHSIVEMLSKYICNIITAMIDKGADSVEVKKEAYTEYNSRLDEAMKDMLWEHENGGGNSYYINKHGKSGVNIPWTVNEFYDLVRDPKFEEFRFK